ncbi:hypothetical protein GE061_018777 [Apolygus lucorum]|uniref:Secreted protein n=1 Tax=Apolygus lucorum TaxID=248454 RepID=A0A8S9X976_APOLU|nr:hypothetical protein GE061_018776 [Apolygus lucorum]KAF6204617.1 hypothetical protein GE061_018777 [Apolygus lucorum]
MMRTLLLFTAVLAALIAWLSATSIPFWGEGQYDDTDIIYYHGLPGVWPAARQRQPADPIDIHYNRGPPGVWPAARQRQPADPIDIHYNRGPRSARLAAREVPRNHTDNDVQKIPLPSLCLGKLGFGLWTLCG